MTNMEALEELYSLMSQYTNASKRSGLPDLWLYDTIIGMYENDYDDVDNMEFIWTKTPDEVMQYIIDSKDVPADLEYGWDAYDEGVREYLMAEKFVVDVEEITEEELKENLEQRTK